MKLPLGITKIPYGWPWMAPAFVDYLRFAIGCDWIREDFRKETGHDMNLLIPRTPLEKMISDATGHTETVLREFGDWIVVNHWGEA